MKFRSKTGEVFENTYEDVTFCGPYKGCIGCPVGNIKQNYDCTEWVNNHPHEATRLMGFKVVEEDEKCATCANQKTVECVTCGALYRNYQEKETDMDKPRICEVLGVDPDEEWTVSGNDIAIYRVSGGVALEYAMPKYNGDGKWLPVGMPCLVDFINHPDRIIRKPRWSEQEVELAKAISKLFPGAKYIERVRESNILGISGEIEAWIADIDSSLFPGIKSGQAVTLDEIIGGAQ